MEHKYFRTELELIVRAFPEKRILTTADVMRYTGRSRNFLNSHGLIGDITISELADKLCKLKKGKQNHHD